MSELFLTILGMSVSASVIILAVLLLRLLFKRAPRWVFLAFWGIVAVRLICPFTVESALSLMPSNSVIGSEIIEAAPERDTDTPLLDRTELATPTLPNVQTRPDSPSVNRPVLDNNSPVTDNNAPAADSAVNSPAVDAAGSESKAPIQWGTVIAAVWAVGVLALLAYMAVSYYRMHRRVCTAILMKENIYRSENVESPFVFGVFRPKIYLPFNTRASDTDYIIAHEKAHISRYDHLVKLFGFMLLALHWFNPLVWLGYVLLSRDIELACDEKVIKSYEKEQRADYSQAILNCSVNRRAISVGPLAFGKVGVKERVKNVLKYKKPTYIIIALAVVAIIVTSVCLLTGPKSEDGGESTHPESSDIGESSVADESKDASSVLDCMTEDNQILYLRGEYKSYFEATDALRYYSYDDIATVIPTDAFVDSGEDKDTFVIIPSVNVDGVRVNRYEGYESSAVAELYRADHGRPFILKCNDYGKTGSNVLVTFTFGEKEYSFAPTLSSGNEWGIDINYPLGEYGDEFTVKDITDYKKQGLYEPYTVHEIVDPRVYTADGRKYFDDGYRALALPLDWKCLEANGEDGSSLYFRHPELLEKCELRVDSSGSQYASKKTEAEYRAYLEEDYTDVKIESLDEETLASLGCQKLIASYNDNGERFVTVRYGNVIDGFAMYDFVITYPESRKDEFAPLFGSVMESVSFASTEQSDVSEDPSEADGWTADELYDEVLSADTMVFADDGEKEITFREFITGFNLEGRMRFDGRAECDIDGDGSKEIFLTASPSGYTYDTVMIRNYNGKVYVWGFTFRQMYNLNTDGTFNWNSYDDYGEDKMVFNSAKLETKEIWRVYEAVGEAAKYYIGEKQVTEKEFNDYFDTNPKTLVEFTPVK